MAADEDFAKKYMFGLAMVSQKGALHIHIIHDVERPMKDMMLGLENWVPLYMTGQISPYYLKGVQNDGLFSSALLFRAGGDDRRLYQRAS